MVRVFRNISYLYFILLAVFWFSESYLSLGIINYPAVAAFVLLMLQLFYDQKYLGIFCGIPLFVFSLYMFISAFFDYFATVVKADGHLKFLIIKALLFGIGVVLSSGLLSYYMKMKNSRKTTN